MEMVGVPMRVVFTTAGVGELAMPRTATPAPAAAPTPRATHSHLCPKCPEETALGGEVSPASARLNGNMVPA